VRVYRGDGGVDVYEERYGADAEVDVYQIKYFPSVWGDTQKQQIRDSYETARYNSDFNLNRWFLCVPVRLTKEAFTKCARARIIAASISFPMCCRSVGCGTTRQIMQSATRGTAAVHMML
jgi:hypothetical protein